MKKKPAKKSLKRSKKGAVKDLEPKANPKGGAFDAFTPIQQPILKISPEYKYKIDFHK